MNNDNFRSTSFDIEENHATNRKKINNPTEKQALPSDQYENYVQTS